jgi:ribosomal protein S18 acetylase RimI-like enzyme
MSTALPVPELRLRPATVDDVPSLHALITEAYTHYIARIGRKPAGMLVDYSQALRDHLVWVLEGPNGVVGLLDLIQGDEHIMIDNLVIAPDHQGRKLGTWLMCFAENEARQRHRRELRLYTHQLMVENQAIYAHLGYEETERRVENGFPRVFMRKLLA